MKSKLKFFFKRTSAPRANLSTLLLLATICYLGMIITARGQFKNYVVDGKDEFTAAGLSDNSVGLPAWRVSEPYINVWLADVPLAYRTTSTETVPVTLAYKQRNNRMNGTTSYGNQPNFGPGWEFSWLSYIEFHVSAGQPVIDHAYMSMGGDRYYVPDGVTKEYHSLSTCTALTTYTFEIDYPSGARDIYGFTYFAPNGNCSALLTKHIDSRNRTNNFNYTTLFYPFNSNVQYVQLSSMVDFNGRTNTLLYASTNPGVIKEIDDPYGNKATFAYDGGWYLTNIVNAAGLSSSFAYAGVGGAISSFTTPYGTQSFVHTNLTLPGGYLGLTNYVVRAVEIIEPDSNRQMYGYRDLSSKLNPSDNTSLLPYSYTSGQVPNTSPIGNTLNNLDMDARNSFYWSRAAYAQLSTVWNIGGGGCAHDVNCGLTVTDYLYARLRHWLGATSQTPAELTDTLDMERAGSLDGTTEGPKVWYDYPGKSVAQKIGTMPAVSLVGVVLPDGSTSFQNFQLSSLGSTTNTIGTYSSGGSVLLRTNSAIFFPNGIDLCELYGPTNECLAAFGYDSNHQPIQVTNSVNEVTSITYDSTTREVTGQTSPSGLTTTNLYYSAFPNQGLVQTAIDLQIYRTNSFTYTNGLVYTSSDARGLVTTNKYDAFYRTTASSNPNGSVSYLYSNLDLIQTVDRLGNTNRYIFNSLHQKISDIDSLGRTNLYSYHITGGLEYFTNPLGEVTRNFYDLWGRSIGTLSADGSWVTNRYNLMGQVTNTTDSAGSSITNWFNNQGLLATSSNAFGQISFAAYDNRDRVTNSVDANGISVNTTYDILNRVWTKTNPDGGVEKFLYSVRGLVGYTNQLAFITRSDFDLAGRKTAETNANSEVVRFTYNAAGDRIKLTDGKSQDTTWGYDLFGRVTSETNAASAVVFKFQYDANNRLTNRWSAAKGTTVYSYDAVGNRTLVNYPVSTDSTLAYDALNRATNMVDAAGTTAFTYNNAGLLQSEDGPWAYDTVTYSYANKLRTGLSLQEPSASDWTESYGYDSAKRLTSLTSPAGAFGYVYTSGCGCPSGSLVKKITLPNGAYITNNFDAMARMMDTTLKNSGNTSLDSRAYLYNVGSQRTKETRFDGSYVDFTYDAIGQLKSALGKESGGSTRLHEQYGYAYDAAGNLNNRTNNALIQTFNVNNKNELTTGTRSGTLTVAGTTSSNATSVTVNRLTATRYGDYTFAKSGFSLADGNNTFTAVAQDALSRSDSVTNTAYLPATVNFGYDSNGNLLTDGKRGFDYDDENQLIRVTVTNSWKTEFSYDGQRRRRVRKEYAWQSGAWTQSAEVRYIYDGNLVIQERDVHNIPLVSYTRGRDLSGRLQGAGGIGGLLGRTDNTSFLSQPSLAHVYYLADGNGNVSALLNSTQALVAKYLYDAYGNLISSSGPLAEVNLYRFSSKRAYILPPVWFILAAAITSRISNVG